MAFETLIHLRIAYLDGKIRRRNRKIAKLEKRLDELEYEDFREKQDIRAEIAVLDSEVIQLTRKRNAWAAGLGPIPEEDDNDDWEYESD